MAKALYYPPADHTVQWWEGDFTRGTMLVMEKVLLHSTETSSWPSYDQGAKAPNLTYNPWVATGRWRQHNLLNTSSRALQDPTNTAVRENRDGVVQVEIIAYCNPVSARQYGHSIADLPATAYEDLGAFVAFMHLEWGVPLTRAAEWDTFPPSDSIRMSGPEYDAFKGLLGHQHASGNDHGDPGMTNAQVDRILTVAKRIVAARTAPPTATGDDDMDVKALLNAHITGTLPDGTTKDFGTLQGVLWTLFARTQDDDSRSNQILARVDGLTAKVDALAAKVQ